MTYSLVIHCAQSLVAVFGKDGGGYRYKFEMSQIFLETLDLIFHRALRLFVGQYFAFVSIQGLCEGCALGFRVIYEDATADLRLNLSCPGFSIGLCVEGV